MCVPLLYAHKNSTQETHSFFFFKFFVSPSDKTALLSPTDSISHCHIYPLTCFVLLDCRCLSSTRITSSTPLSFLLQILSVLMSSLPHSNMVRYDVSINMEVINPLSALFVWVCVITSEFHISLTQTANNLFCFRTLCKLRRWLNSVWCVEPECPDMYKVK